MQRFTTTLPVFVILAFASLTSMASAQVVTVYMKNDTAYPANIIWTSNSGEQKLIGLVSAGQTQPINAQVGQRLKLVSASSTLGSAGGTVTHAHQVYSLSVQPQSQPQSYPEYPQTYPSQTNVQQSIPEMNQKILQFAQSKIGQHVRFNPYYSNAQCTELVEAALNYAGAQGGNQNYSWGREVALQNVKPGDIVQQRSVRFDYPNGAWNESDNTHTAIVTRVEGSKIHVLEQNIEGSAVRQGFYDAQYLTRGTMKFYRPVAGTNRGGLQQVGYGNPQVDFQQGTFGNGQNGFNNSSNGAALSNLIMQLID